MEKFLRKVPQLVKTVRKLICKSNLFLEKPVHVRFDRGDSSKRGKHLDSTRDDGGYSMEREFDGETRPFFAAIFATGSIEDPARR